MAAAVRENALGAARCPCCDSRRAALRLSAKGLAYLVCNTCNVQIFARSERSDDLLRDLLIPAAPSAPEVVMGSPSAPPKEVMGSPASPKPAPVPTPAPAPKRSGFFL